jgi:hydrogenase/urease accessory protein HupE
VAHELNLPAETPSLDSAFLQQHGEAWAALVVRRLHVQGDGREAVFVPVDVEVGPGGQTVVVRLRAPFERPASLHIRAWMFPYDPIHETFVKVYEDGRLTAEDILTADRPAADHVIGHPQRRTDVVRRFLLSGIQHIAIGPDHILFLVGLLLAGGRVWQIVRIVTAFTVAHSITLSLAVLKVVSPPAALIEPAIALSICYVGVDNLLRTPGGRDRRAWIALAFGLIHGFGFANVLGALELPRAALGWSLLSFNVGVEIGQLAIVLIVTFVLTWIGRSYPVTRQRITIAGSVVVIWAGFYWFVD